MASGSAELWVITTRTPQHCSSLQPSPAECSDTSTGSTSPSASTAPEFSATVLYKPLGRHHRPSDRQSENDGPHWPRRDGSFSSVASPTPTSKDAGPRTRSRGKIGRYHTYYRADDITLGLPLALESPHPHTVESKYYGGPAGLRALMSHMSYVG
jgi:hypothetical protein